MKPQKAHNFLSVKENEIEDTQNLRGRGKGRLRD